MPITCVLYVYAIHIRYLYTRAFRVILHSTKRHFFVISASVVKMYYTPMHRYIIRIQINVAAAGAHARVITLYLCEWFFVLKMSRPFQKSRWTNLDQSIPYQSFTRPRVYDIVEWRFIIILCTSGHTDTTHVYCKYIGIRCV